jgi:hypothetical protein
METQPEPKARTPLLLPSRPRGEKANSFRKVSLITNHYGIKVSKPLDKIVIFSIRFEPRIVEDNRNLRQALLERILPEVRKTIGKDGFTQRTQ